MTYAEKLKSPKWQRKRLKIYERDNFTCKLCGDTETTLNVHHLKYSANPIETPDYDLITLCQHCHKFVEDMKLKEIGMPILLSKEKHPEYDMQAFIATFPSNKIYLIVYSQGSIIPTVGIPKDIFLRLAKSLLNG